MKKLLVWEDNLDRSYEFDSALAKENQYRHIQGWQPYLPQPSTELGFDSLRMFLDSLTLGKMSASRNSRKFSTAQIRGLIAEMFGNLYQKSEASQFDSAGCYTVGVRSLGK